MKKNHSTDTDPALPVLPPGSDAFPPMAVDIAGRTHPGLVRPNNEDNFHVVRFGRYLRTVLTSFPDELAPAEDARPGYGFAVADGVGGHAAGEVASRAAIALLVELALETPDWFLGRDDEALAAVMERMTTRIRLVGEAVSEYSRSQPNLRGMGTTLALALSLSDALIVAHVGDSRVYLFRGGELHRLTRDHTIGQQLADIDPAAAVFLSHVLTRCIGGGDTGSDPDVTRYRLADGDRLLLCSDGLTDMADDASIAEEMGRETTSDEVCRALIELALNGGGKDNVTAVVATYRRPGPPAAQPTSPT